MPARVIDTNVPVVANGGHESGPRCQLEAIRVIREITAGGGLVLDTGGRIFSEYQTYLSFSGQPGVGDEFFRWVHDFQWRDEYCTRVMLTPTAADPDDFVEFPSTTPGLETFDRADRKFIAVAVANGAHTEVVEATDGEWWECREAFSEAGITITFICEDYISTL